MGAAVGWVEGVCKGRSRWGAAVGWVEGVGDGSGGSGAEGVIGVGSRGAEDRGLDGYRVARRGLGGGFLMRLLITIDCWVKSRQGLDQIIQLQIISLFSILLLIYI